MRIWDLSPAYLNRHSLLAEHRELHGIVSILTGGKKGYSRHPETVRWVGALGGLGCRHALLAAEMALRGYVDRTPVPWTPSNVAWPQTFVTEPADQISLLRTKYAGRLPGRLTLPRNTQQLWAQHKYSVMARSPETYRRLGRLVSRPTSGVTMPDLVRELVLVLREAPTEGRLVNALEHMWGHVRPYATADDVASARRGPWELLSRTQSLARRVGERYLLQSTALSELAAHEGARRDVRSIW